MIRVILRFKSEVIKNGRISSFIANTGRIKKDKREPAEN